MKDKIPNGTKVLIFNFNDEFRHEEEKEKRYKWGEVVDNTESNDLNPWYERIYTVIGEDGKTYVATHANAVFGISDFYIKTINEHISYVMGEIKENNEKINNLNEKNAMLSGVITSLLRMKNQENNKTKDNSVHLVKKKTMNSKKTI